MPSPQPSRFSNAQLARAVRALSTQCSKAPTCRNIDKVAWTAVKTACELIISDPTIAPKILSHALTELEDLRKIDMGEVNLPRSD